MRFLVTRVFKLPRDLSSSATLQDYFLLGKFSFFPFVPFFEFLSAFVNFCQIACQIAWVGVWARRRAFRCPGAHLGTRAGIQAPGRAFWARQRDFWHPGGVLGILAPGSTFGHTGGILAPGCTFGHAGRHFGTHLGMQAGIFIPFLDNTVCLLETNVFMRQLIVQILFVFF